MKDKLEVETKKEEAAEGYVVFIKLNQKVCAIFNNYQVCCTFLYSYCRTKSHWRMFACVWHVLSITIILMRRY